MASLARILLIFTVLSSPSACRTDPGAAVKDDSALTAADGACVFTCDSGQAFCAPGTADKCTDATVAALFAEKGLAFPRCLGQSLVFTAGGACRANDPKGSCEVTCDSGEKFCAPGTKSKCTTATASKLFADQGVAFPRCLSSGVQWTPFKCVVPDPQGSCTFTCDSGETFCAQGAKSKCTTDTVAKLFEDQGVAFPRCLGAGLDFATGGRCAK